MIDPEHKADRFKHLDLALIIIPFFFVFFFFFFFKDAFDYSLKKTDLIRIKGVIESSKTYHRTSNKASNEKSGIHFKLIGQEEIYHMAYQGQEALTIAKKYFKINDTVVLYHRHRWQQLISWGDLHKIYYIECNKKVVRDNLNRPKEVAYYMNLILGSIIFTIWLCLLIFYYAKYKPQHTDAQSLLL